MEQRDFTAKIKPECEKAIDFFEREMAKIHTTRLSPALVEDIKVNCFGTECPLKQLAAISLIDARQILLEPWDKSYLEPIQKAIAEANLGFSLVTEKQTIRLRAPVISEDYRRNLAKRLAEKKEKARRTIRHFREEAWREIQEACRKGEVSEDEKYRLKDELQDLVDEYNGKIDELAERKQKEIEG